VVCSVHGAVLAPGLGLIPICAFALIPSGRETQILHRAGAGKGWGQIAAYGRNATGRPRRLSYGPSTPRSTPWRYPGINRRDVRSEGRF
jgi:hypothetical protein